MALVSKEFVVRITASEGEEWALTPDEVYDRLTDAVGFSDTMWVHRVRLYKPPGQVFTGKIPAIKHLRSIVEGASLVESKDMIDAAISLGKFHVHGGILIEYHSAPENWVITDNRAS